MPPKGWIQAKVETDDCETIKRIAVRENSTVSRVAGRLIAEGLARLWKENKKLVQRREAREGGAK